MDARWPAAGNLIIITRAANGPVTMVNAVWFGHWVREPSWVWKSERVGARVVNILTLNINFLPMFHLDRGRR